MAQNGHKEHPKYFKIFWWLLALTIIEVAVAIPEYSIVLKAILLIGLASSKAALVAIYFMHLKFERKTLAAIVITPFLICVFLVIMLMPDLTAGDRLDGIEIPTEVVDTSAH
ncbi:cytochrome C oxidase subunit IV family protein [Candidatus Poribacteria bacterium]|nr:cytochrome C oxidase subunit IV family protein [Candidatus Poribacteria bacterium]MXY27606.1 cytochrome C oxidase subunit IV family protein [Candidatus Poribacteria bacterium]MYK18397.1 cytochrome C oxidase subunit IV family protein [Candidatus Poribacteria bacterium]